MPTIYASPSGSGDGATPSTPASLANAKAAARAATGDVAVVLRGGTYQLAAPLVFDASDSGEAGKMVRWRAYGGEVPVLSGGIPVAGWTLHDAGRNIYRASVAPGTLTRQLWVNGARATRARSTARGFASSNGGTTYVSTDATLPASFARPTDLEFVFTKCGMSFSWIEDRLVASAVSRVGDTTTATMPNVGARFFPHWTFATWPTAPTYVENAYEFLSASTPGQWYLDRVASTLYYVPRPGEDMATADVRLPVLETLLSCAATSPLADVEFSGIGFEHTGWTAPTTLGCFLEEQANAHRDVPAEWPAAPLYACPMPPAAVTLLGAQRVTITGCDFSHLGGMGLHIGAMARSCAVSDSAFSDLSSNGMRIGDYSSWTQLTGDVVVERNTVDGAGIDYRGAVGIFAGIVDHVRILHNEVQNCPNSGVSLGWGWSGADYTTSTANGNEIAWNKIHAVMTTVSDGAGIYTLGVQGASRLSVHHNYVYDVGSGSGPYEHSLYSDDGTRYADFTSNVCVRKGTQAYWFRSNTDASYNSASSNFATTGMTTLINSGGSTTQAPTYITGTNPAGWPAAAQAIAAGAGPTDPPTVTGLDVPASPHASTDVGVTVTATDDVGVTDYAVTVDSLDAPTSWQPTGSFTVVVAEGTHTLRAYARDGAGNVSAPYLATITVALPAPEPVGVAGVFPMRGSMPMTLMHGTAAMNVKKGTIF